MTWREIAGDLPLAVGLQLRNIALADVGVKLVTPGNSAEKMLSEVFDDPEDIAQFLGESA